MEIVRSQRESTHAAASTTSAKLSFYRSVPALEVRLEDFKLYGIDRLRVLQGISDGLPRGKRPEEMEKLVLPDTLFFKAPFEEVPELFVGRRVFLQKGFAYVAMHQAVSLVATQFRSNLSKCLVLTNRDRIGYGIVLTRISRQNALLKFTQLLKAKEQVVAGKMYYLTLEANDCGSKKQYEAKVWVKPWMNFMELKDFKPLTDSPSTSSQDKKQLEQSSEGEKKESVRAPSENRILK
ncbi:hypothetical protein ZIOFF_056873 [Zingiber officinale]|uniref:Cysteine proteinase inhibitor n=1 Tax=Zingiber officinale TaxID=94328 RepID=A0A8J5FIJ3_ZINOF|nr:hypothetical protein ZIOFF_056873 [Zingiber officinale]